MTGPPVVESEDRDILSVEGLSLSFGGLAALADVDLSIRPGSITGIIGPNGAGKTSLLNCISGFYRPQRGRVRFDGQDVTRVAPDRRAALGIGRTFQNVALFEGMSVLDNVKLGAHARLRSGILSTMAFTPGARREELAAARAGGERGPRLPGDRAPAPPHGGEPGLRPAEAGRPGPGAGHAAAHPAPRRAGGRHERGGDRGHGPLHPRHPGGAGRDHRAHRARHGRGHGPVRPHRRPLLRRAHRRGHARRDPARPRGDPRLPGRGSQRERGAGPPPPAARLRRGHRGHLRARRHGLRGGLQGHPGHQLRHRRVHDAGRLLRLDRHGRAAGPLRGGARSRRWRPRRSSAWPPSGSCSAPCSASAPSRSSW